MHTSIVVVGGREYRAHVASDLDDDGVRTVTFEVDGAPTNVVPGRLLLELVGEHMIRQRVSALQNLTGSEYIGRMSKGGT